MEKRFFICLALFSSSDFEEHASMAEWTSCVEWVVTKSDYTLTCGSSPFVDWLEKSFRSPIPAARQSIVEERQIRYSQKSDLLGAGEGASQTR